jgi:hypothetical protein
MVDVVTALSSRENDVKNHHPKASMPQRRESHFNTARVRASRPKKGGSGAVIKFLWN